MTSGLTIPRRRSSFACHPRSISSAYARPRWIPGTAPSQGDVVELTIALAHEEHVVLRAVVAVHVVDDPSAGQTRQIGFGRIVRHSFAPFPHDVRACPGQTFRHTHMHRTGRKTIIKDTGNGEERYLSPASSATERAGPGKGSSASEGDGMGRSSVDRSGVGREMVKHVVP